MQNLSISLVIFAAAAIMNLWLAIRVGQMRSKTGIHLGHGDSDALYRRRRAQANFIEYAPFIMGLILLLDYNDANKNALWAIGAGFIIARILHALGMDKDGWMRTAGTIATLLIMTGLAIWALVVYVTVQMP